MTQPVSVKAVPRAKVRIPIEVQEELLQFVILRNQLHRIHAGIADREDSIIEKLIGRKMDNALGRDLLAAHNRRAAKIQRRAGAQR